MAVSKSGDEPRGPSWGDIRLMMQEVGAASDVRVDIHCCTAEGRNRSEALVWTVRAFPWGTWGERPPLAFESGLWPTSGFATVPGLLYALLHRLDSKLEQLRADKAKQRQTSF